MVNFEGALLNPVAIMDFASALQMAPIRKLAGKGTWRTPEPSAAATKILASSGAFSIKASFDPSGDQPPDSRLDEDASFTLLLPSIAETQTSLRPFPGMVTYMTRDASGDITG